MTKITGTAAAYMQYQSFVLDSSTILSAFLLKGKKNIEKSDVSEEASSGAFANIKFKRIKKHSN